MSLKTEEDYNMAKNVSIKIDSVFCKPEFRDHNRKLFAEEGVASEFIGTNDEDSMWALTGTIEDLRKVVYKYWLQHGLLEPSEVLSPEAMITLEY